MAIKMTKSEYNAFADRVMSQLDSVAKRIDDELSTRYMEDLDKLIKNAINQFYSAYKPKYYGRKFSLKYMYRLTPSGSGVNMDFGGEFTFASHDIDNESIFDLSFMEGYHGGAKTGEGHPSPGIPYWKSHKSHYTEWSMPAVQSEAPMQLIDDAIDAYNGTAKKIQIEVMVPIIKKWLWG